jgi:hypothetical protein
MTGGDSPTLPSPNATSRRPYSTCVSVLANALPGSFLPYICRAIREHSPPKPLLTHSPVLISTPATAIQST